jgi:hypothetical protein
MNDAHDNAQTDYEALRKATRAAQAADDLDAQTRARRENAATRDASADWDGEELQPVVIRERTLEDKMRYITEEIHRCLETYPRAATPVGKEYRHMLEKVWLVLETEWGEK